MLRTSPLTDPLVEWAEQLAERREATVPLFDPAEAGTGARVLLLLEAPGPMANDRNVRPGSGFISVDNDDETAANVWRARNDAGLHDGFLAWNIVPWYLGRASRKPTAEERRGGAAALLELLALLPALDTVVLGGRHARAGWRVNVSPRLDRGFRVIETWHPSPLALNKAVMKNHFWDSMRVAASPPA